jgi:hypothetical protein
MTAIVFRHGIMAADSAVWCDGVVLGHHQKITRLSDGTLVAACGPTAYVIWFSEWIAKGSPDTNKELDDGFEGLVARSDGTIEYWNGKLMKFNFDAEFCAIGAQNSFMAGALYAGATAEETVRLTIKHTDGAAGTVQIEYLCPAIREAAE